MCRLCVRKDEQGRELCLACRAGAIERAEERAKPISSRMKLIAIATPSGSARLARTSRVRRHLVLLPFVVVTVLAAMAAFVVPLFAEAKSARAERRAESALRAIFEGEHAGFAGGWREFLTLEELRQRKLVGVLDVPGYELQVELARDRKKFWARAIPVQAGLRRLYVDARGEVSPEGE